MYDPWPIFLGHSALLGQVSNQVALMAAHLIVDRPPSKSPVGNGHFAGGGINSGIFPIVRVDLSRAC